MNEPTSERENTNRKASRKTHWSVYAIDHLAKWLITIGGIGAIVAVSVVMVFLVWVAAPLFYSADVEYAGANETAWETNGKQLLNFEVDDYQLLGWALFSDGEVNVIRINTGEIISRRQMGNARSFSAISVIPGSDTAAIAYTNGEIALGRIRFTLSFNDIHQFSSFIQELKEGESLPYQEGIVTKIPNQQYRIQKFSAEFDEPLLNVGKPIQTIHHTVGPKGLSIASLTEDGDLSLHQFSEQTNFLTGESTSGQSSVLLPYQPPVGAEKPVAVKTTSLGANVVVVWRDGLLQRYDTRDPSQSQLVETVDLVKDEGATLTALDMLIGQKTLLIGDSTGRVSAWFLVLRPEANTSDGRAFVKAHEYRFTQSPVTALAVSHRSRNIGIGHANGRLCFMNVTSGKVMMETATLDQSPVSSVTVAVKDDGLIALAGSKLFRWLIDPLHPEVTMSSVFSKVWYEGYSGPKHVWQSSSGTDGFEPKYGLAPLLFGTMKATLYSMLFALPIALLAAVYTSEFLHPRTKALFKPTIELMASLPSVVLGFMAALIFSVWVEYYLASLLMLFITAPFSFVLCAYLFQLLPEAVCLRLLPYRFLFILLAMPIGFWLAMVFGPFAESIFFAGNIMLWLDGQVGGATGGWMFILFPASALTVFYFNARWVNPSIRYYTAGWSRRKMALFDLMRFLGASCVTLSVAWGVSSLLASIGTDPRGAYIDTYVQRNALIVGLVMGFAVIPIIYTIAEDALSSVPGHLRSASLGCGATQWQTAAYIVIPTAMSGLFSAVMIGLGRAVGETMIVLMAAGNTPILSWNMFNGYRTLSANIAVELAEAVRNSTHYRMLFLSALTLFVMTFILNTLAEMVRLRFRRRTQEL